MSDVRTEEKEYDLTETITNLVTDVRFRIEQYSIGTSVRDIEWNQCRNYSNDEDGVEGFDVRVYGEYVPIPPITDAVNESVFRINEVGHMDDPNGDTYVSLFVAPRDGSVTDSIISDTDADTDTEDAPVLTSMTVFEAVQLHQPVGKDDLYDVAMLSQYSKDEINNTLIDLLNDDVIYFDLDWNIRTSDENELWYLEIDYDSDDSTYSGSITESLQSKERLSVGEVSDLKDSTDDGNEYSYSVTDTLDGDDE
jgi:hypothetical protein